MNIILKRVYDPDDGDANGYRVLVDRLWPRGIAKADLGLDEWCPEIAPSTGLRKWFAHAPERWDAFRLKYIEELRGQEDRIRHLQEIARKQPLILLFAAQDRDKNQAVVIREVLQDTRESGEEQTTNRHT